MFFSVAIVVIMWMQLLLEWQFLVKSVKTKRAVSIIEIIKKKVSAAALKFFTEELHIIKGKLTFTKSFEVWKHYFLHFQNRSLHF